ncbi:MAG: glycosyltransferase family 4 protein [Candidatus Caldarchaeum sp.]
MGLLAELTAGYDVVLVSPTSVGMGGIARHVSGLVSRLVEKGYKVAVISSENTPVLGVKGLKNPSFMVTSSLKAWFYRGQVVHAHNLPSSPAMRLARAGKRILTLHGVYAEQVGLLHGTVLGNAAAFFEKVFLTWADVVTTVSRQAAATYKSLGFETVYIPNAVEIPHKVERMRLGMRQVVNVGRLSREKNVEALLSAARQLPETTFVIVGGGPEYHRLKSLSKGLKNVVFTGEVSHDKALGYIAGSDLLVLPSLVEGLSTVLLEAMACKTPVIATRVGGNVELVKHGYTGVLIEPADIQALVEAIRKLLDDRPFAVKLAENAYKMVLENFSWDAVFPKYLEVYGLE